MHGSGAFALSEAAGRRPARGFGLLRRLGALPLVTGGVLLVFVVLGIAGPVLVPFDPVLGNLLDKSLPPTGLPSSLPNHPFGTDHLGRDILSRLIGGARISLVVAVCSIALSALIGGGAGVLAGYWGGPLDFLLMRLADMALSIPALLLGIVMVAALQPSLTNVIVAAAVLLCPVFARQLRAETLSLKHELYIEAARTIGAQPGRIIGRHIGPNLIPTATVLATYQVTQVIILEASLSFLGVGVPPPAPSWGSMIAEGKQFIFIAWWMVFFPGAGIALVALSLTFLGDWLRDQLDPRLRRRAS